MPDGLILPCVTIWPSSRKWWVLIKFDELLYKALDLKFSFPDIHEVIMQMRSIDGEPEDYFSTRALIDKCRNFTIDIRCEDRGTDAWASSTPGFRLTLEKLKGTKQNLVMTSSENNLWEDDEVPSDALHQLFEKIY